MPSVSGQRLWNSAQHLLNIFDKTHVLLNLTIVDV